MPTAPEEMTLKVIAHIHTAFPTKFGIPRQSGLVDELRGEVIFTPEYRNADAVRGLEDFSHIWLVWQFSGAVRDSWSRRVWAATPAWACSPPGRPSVPILWAFPACVWKASSTGRTLARCSSCAVPT